jgi:hypothetical protein
MGNTLPIVIVLIIIYIFAILDNYTPTKKIEEFKHLTGNFRHKKTPKGVITEVEVRYSNELFYRKGTKEELKFLNINKYIE